MSPSSRNTLTPCFSQTKCSRVNNSPVKWRPIAEPRMRKECTANLGHTSPTHLRTMRSTRRFSSLPLLRLPSPPLVRALGRLFLARGGETNNACSTLRNLKPPTKTRVMSTRREPCRSPGTVQVMYGFDGHCWESWPPKIKLQRPNRSVLCLR